MKKPEQWFWRNRLRPILNSIKGLHYDRVESLTCVGIPDLHIASPAGFTWVEMKAGEVRGNTLFVPTLKSVQIEWISTRGRLCGRVFVHVWEPKIDETFLFDHNIDASIGPRGDIPIDASMKRGVTKGYWEDILL